jgi:hypothetical protein
VAIALVLRRRTGSDLLELAAPRTADRERARPQIEPLDEAADAVTPPEEPEGDLEPGS